MHVWIYYTVFTWQCFVLTHYLSTLFMTQFKTLDDTKPVYTEEELQRFEVELRDKELELGRRADKLRQEQELLKERSKALEAQKREYQQVGSFICNLSSYCYLFFFFFYAFV